MRTGGIWGTTVESFMDILAREFQWRAVITWDMERWF